MRTVTLELLRHGPSHNQLLSPLTPYLALCENHAPVTLNVPFEHNQFLHRLTALTYEFGMSQLADNQRQFQLSDTGRELGRLLAAIPGLTAELNRHREESSEVIHLRLVLSASELALLPFELVLAGNGFPGFGQPLLLQNKAPICLTREVRRVKDVTLSWTPEARILFVCASPSGLPPVPAEAHLLALRRAVGPWIGYFDEDIQDSHEARRQQVDKCLHVLPQATIGAIQDACASGEFSHVHILAHGVARHDGFDLRFGIALHDEADPESTPDVVSGDRLASALRPLARPDRDGFARPMVVTLASCNGANGGSVVGAGASVAHALQEAGIPLIVAGQFPLTFEGSVELVETLYDGLLWGADPRSLLMDLRRRMHVLQPHSHDWAALTAYASLPSNFDAQLRDLEVGRAKAAIDRAMDHADRVLMKYAQTDSGLPEVVAKRVRQRIERPWATMQALLDRVPERRLELLGLLASLCKRRAEIELADKMLSGTERPLPASQLKECMALLDKSRAYYMACFRERRDVAWAIVQYLCLSLLIELPAEPDEGQLLGRVQERRGQYTRLWELARALSVDDLQQFGERAGWALGSLIELSLMAIILDRPIEKDAEPWREQAQGWLDELKSRAENNEFEIYSTRRQIDRYNDWFGLINKRFQQVEGIARELMQRLPPEIEDDGAGDGPVAGIA
jgi:hypothetical protein